MEYRRILKPNASAVLYFGYKHMGWIGYELQRRGWFSFRQPLILEKANPQPQVRQSGFRSQMETAIRIVNDGGTFARPRTFNFLGQDRMLSIIPYKIGHEGRKGKKHPTEKPLEPIARYIEVFTNP